MVHNCKHDQTTELKAPSVKSINFRI